MTVPIAPSYADIQADGLAALQATAVTTVQGQRVPLDTEAGSLTLAESTAIALVLSAFYRRQDLVQDAVSLDSAQGDDLDRLVALIGVQRVPAAQAQIPYLFWRNTATPAAINIPVGLRVLAPDVTGQPAIGALTTQAPGLLPGVAGVIPASGQGGWAYATAETAGALGNVGNSAQAVLGSPLAGVDTASNPKAGQPGAPTASIVGTAGTTTLHYCIVGRGYTGFTLPGAITTVTTANATLSTGNAVALSWTYGTDGGAVPPAGFDVLKQVAGQWQAIATAVPAQSFADTGQTPMAYSLPATDTSNRGVGGVDQESDEALRVRAPGALARAAVSTKAAIEGAVEALPNVRLAICTDTGAGTCSVQYVATQYPFSTTQTAAVVAAIAATKAAGIQATPLPLAPTQIDVTYAVQVQASVSPATSLAGAIQTAVAAYFGTLSPGDPVRFSAVIGAIMAVPGVRAVTNLLLQPEGASAATAFTDVGASAGVLYALNPSAVTASAGY